MTNKIAIVVCAWPPQGGGIGNNAYYHLNELKKIGYEATAFTPRYSNEKSGDGVEYIKVTLPIGKAGFLFGLFSRLKNFEIIHFYYPFFGTDLIIWLFKILNPQKKIVLHYEMDPIGRGWQRIIFKLYIKLFLGLLIKISDRVAVLSWDNARGSYLNKYLSCYKNKFVELPNGVDVEIFQSQEPRKMLADNYGITASDQVVVFVGGLDDQHFFKGVDVLLEALVSVKEKISTVKLLIIGDGNRRGDYQKRALDLGLAERVIFTGWVKNELLPDYYNLSQVFVLPSTERTESFGIVIAEAQACGIPAIVSNWPGSRQTIENNQTGLLVEPKSVSDLAEKLIYLLQDENLRKKMGEAAVVRVRERYGWDVVIRKIDNLYNQITEIKN